MKDLQKLIFAVLLLLIWTLFYEFINRVLKVKASKYGQIDTKNRIVSIMHGQISFWLCTLTLLFNPNIEKYLFFLFKPLKLPYCQHYLAHFNVLLHI